MNRDSLCCQKLARCPICLYNSPLQYHLVWLGSCRHSFHLILNSIPCLPCPRKNITILTLSEESIPVSFPLLPSTVISCFLRPTKTERAKEKKIARARKNLYELSPIATMENRAKSAFPKKRPKKTSSRMERHPFEV